MTNDNTRDSNTSFEKRAREVLLAAEHDVSPEVNGRLAAMRRAAVQELETRSGQPRRTGWFWVSAGTVAVVVLTLGLFLYPGNAPGPLFDGLDEAQLAAAQDMELLEELEFLAWMEEEDRSAG